MTAQVTALIVTYRSEDTIGECLSALRTSHAAGLTEACVLENASGDGTPALVRRDHPWATMVENPGNLGYGRGLNAGLPHVKTPYVLFMNPDVTVGEDALRALVQFMDAHPSAGMCGPAIARAAGDYQQLMPLPTPWRLLSAAAGRAAATPRPCEPGSAPAQTDWLCGAVMLARTELMQRIAGFDPRFFLYYEETDLCVRVRAAGAELWAVGQAVVHHASNSSARKIDPALADGGCISEHFFRSRYYYLVKHHGWAAAAFTEVGELAVKGARDVARWLLRRRPASGLAERLRSPIMQLPDKVTTP